MRVVRNVGGFTLIELAVVMVIVGLITSAVLVGADLIGNSRIRGVISELESFNPAIKTFVDKYKELPGDMSDAASYFSGGVNGDGDEQIEWSSDEGVQAWYQLQEARMLVNMGLTGTATSNTAVVGTNIPQTVFASDGGWYLDYLAGFGNHFGLGSQESSGINDGVLLIGKEASEIDNKLDDNDADTGRVRGIGGANCHSSGVYKTKGTNANVRKCVMEILLSTEYGL